MQDYTKPEGLSIQNSTDTYKNISDRMGTYWTIQSLREPNTIQDHELYQTIQD